MHIIVGLKPAQYKIKDSKAKPLHSPIRTIFSLEKKKII